MNWFGSSCRRAHKLARLAAAGCLSEPERVWLTRHTGICSDCRYYAAEVNVVRQFLQAWERTTPEPTVTAELSAQWQKAIETEARLAIEIASRPRVPAVERPGWLGIDRAVPVSLVLIWLVAIGFHLNTPPIRSSPADGFVPTLQEVRLVVEWLIRTREAA